MLPTRTVALCAALVPFLTPAAADPPRVVRAVPAHGEVDVDPQLTEIRVEFDQDMRTDGYSWCGGGPLFPDVAGDAFWESPRVCVLPVKLRPGHSYRLSINCPAATNFRSTRGEPARFYPLQFRTASDAETRPASEAVPPEVQKASVKALREAVDKRYSYRDIRSVDWDRVFDEYAFRLEPAKTAEEFAFVAGLLLAEAEDIHIRLEFDGRSYPTFRRAVPPNANYRLLPKLVPGWQQRNAVVATGEFPDGIVYLEIKSWSADQDVRVALEQIAAWSDEKGLIVDVRRNSGGDEGLARQVAGCFIDQPVVYAKHVLRDASASGGFTAPRDRTLTPTAGVPTFRGRVAVLTGRHVMSSCEAFLLMMRQNRRCRLVGETSYGASGNPRPHRLPNRVVVYLPSWKALTPEGECFEGVGIPPDVHVPTTPERFAERDPVLDAALELLRGGGRPAETRPTPVP